VAFHVGHKRSLFAQREFGHFWEFWLLLSQKNFPLAVDKKSSLFWPDWVIGLAVSGLEERLEFPE